jgi:hypothetical protein
LMLHARFCSQSGKICKVINVIPRILIPPFPGSNPGAPAIPAFAFVRAAPRLFVSPLKSLL